MTFSSGTVFLDHETSPNNKPRGGQQYSKTELPTGPQKNMRVNKSKNTSDNRLKLLAAEARSSESLNSPSGMNSEEEGETLPLRA